MPANEHLAIDAAQFARRLETFSDWSQRAIAFADWIAAHSPEEAAELFGRAIVACFKLRDNRSTIAAESAMLAALHDHWPARHRRHVREAAAAYDDLVTLSFLTADPDPAAPYRDVAEEDLDVPDYGVGRPLTLGERRTVSLRPSRRLIERALLDPHPLVVIGLLANPKLVEGDVVRMAARRPGATPALVEIALHPRWRRRRRISLSLVHNPALPPSFAVSLLPWLARGEAREIADDRRLPDTVRDAALVLLAAPPVEFLQPP